LTSKVITRADAQNVLMQTDHAREGIELARSISSTDASGADAKLRATVAVLTALQAYLAARQPR
jgi:hypothetical protein